MLATALRGSHSYAEQGLQAYVSELCRRLTGYLDRVRLTAGTVSRYPVPSLPKSGNGDDDLGSYADDADNGSGS